MIAIAYLAEHNPELLKESIEKDIIFFDVSPRDPIVIIIPSKYYSETLNKDVVTYFSKWILCKPYHKSDLPDAFKYMTNKRNGKSFKSNKDLENQISEVNIFYKKKNGHKSRIRQKL